MMQNSSLGIRWEIALRWMPPNLTNERSTLSQVIAWCCQATNHCLKPMLTRVMLPYDVTWPQCIKASLSLAFYLISVILNDSGLHGPQDCFLLQGLTMHSLYALARTLRCDRLISLITRKLNHWQIGCSVVCLAYQQWKLQNSTSLSIFDENLPITVGFPSQMASNMESGFLVITSFCLCIWPAATSKASHLNTNCHLMSIRVT